MKRLFIILVLLLTTPVFAGLDAKGGKVINVATATDSTDAANKQYVDDTSTETSGFNVKDFGATGDGSTDDTAAIQAAIDACEDAGGGVVLFPPGIYIANNLTFSDADASAWKPEEIHIVGYGAEIKNTHVSNPTFYCSVTYKRGIYFEGLHLNGNNESTLAFDLTGAIRVRFDRISIHNHNAGGIYLVTCYYGYMNDVMVKCNTPDAGAKGAEIVGGGGNFKIISCEFDGWPVGCEIYHLISGGGISYSSFEKCTVGLSISFAWGSIIQGCYFGDNSADDLLIGTTGAFPECRGMVIQGNYFVAGDPTNAINAINIDRATELVIQGNYCDSRTSFINTTANTILQTGAIVPNQIRTVTNYVNGPGVFIQALDNTGTPSLGRAGRRTWLTGGTTTITDFDKGIAGQVIILLAEHSRTITDGTNIFLNGSIDFDMLATDTLTLIQKADGKWYELSRKVDSGKVIIGSDPPATASSTGTAGTITYDSDYFYVAVATDTWKRAAITTWAVVVENVIFAGENVIFAGEQVVYP